MLPGGASVVLVVGFTKSCASAERSIASLPPSAEPAQPPSTTCTGNRTVTPSASTRASLDVAFGRNAETLRMPGQVPAGGPRCSVIDDYGRHKGQEACTGRVDAPKSFSGQLERMEIRPPMLSA